VTVVPQPGPRRSTSIWLFFVVAFDASWPFWSVAVFMGLSVEGPSGEVLFRVGLLGPLVAGILFAWLGRSDGSWREYWMRLADPRRIAARWYAVILLFMPALMALAVLWDMAFETGTAFPLIGRRMAPFVANPALIAPTLLNILLLGPLSEEFGWRGYALDRLQQRFTPAVSSLILGALWALWQLPLFFIRDTFHHDDLGAWTPGFWVFVVQVIAMTFVMTWIFNHTRRSTLGAILFRYMASLAMFVANVSDETNFLATLLLLIAAVVICLRHRPAIRRT